MRKLINLFDSWYTAVLAIPTIIIVVWAMGCLVIFSVQNLVPAKVLVVATIIFFIVILFFMIWFLRAIWEINKEVFNNEK